MDFDLEGGKYIVAVSGGVDSVALLHALLEKQHSLERKANTKNENNSSDTEVKTPSKGSTLRRTLRRGLTRREIGGGDEYEFVVAHFDHGIRSESAQDRRFVEKLCKAYGVPFLYATGNLGKDASEATAREARYKFLHEARRAVRARAVLTAHHQDDAVETIIMNLLRGTNNRGLHSLKSTDIVKRPLLGMPKKMLKTYAALHNLRWREDPTNADTKYLRNYIRHEIVPKMGVTHRQKLLKHSTKAAQLQTEIDAQTAHILHLQPHTHRLDRLQFVSLGHGVACEVMATWIRQRAGVELSKKLIERLVVAAKTGKLNATVDVTQGWRLRILPKMIELCWVSLVS